MTPPGSIVPSGFSPPPVGVRGEVDTSGTATVVTSEWLLGARGELKIQHNGEQYLLRRTRQGKLILTK